MEIWKNIENYEGVYQVSNLGNVKRLSGSKRCKSDRLLTLKTKKNGYKFVCLSVNSKYKYFHVHRLVALAFIPIIYNKNYVNHKDMNKSNNNTCNLEWTTSKENNDHARLNKVFIKNNKKGIDNNYSIQICQKNTNGDILYLWESASVAAIKYNVTSSCIAKACRLRNISVGYLWEYIDRDYYRNNKDKYINIPDVIVENTRKRNMSKARISRINNLKLITNEMLIKTGCECFNIHGRIIRKEYDIIARENKTLTYVPTVNRFGSWSCFKKEVLKNIVSHNHISKITSPLNSISI